LLDIENFTQKQRLKMKYPSLSSFEKSSCILEKYQMKFLEEVFFLTGLTSCLFSIALSETDGKNQ